MEIGHKVPGGRMNIKHFLNEVASPCWTIRYSCKKLSVGIKLKSTLNRCTSGRQTTAVKQRTLYRPR
jgi:hypothetical protein